MPHQWPLLADDQDASSLEARLAFHLHRLGLAGAPLKRTGFIKPQKAHLLSQARVRLTRAECAELAAAFKIPTSELTRPLTTEEVLDWTFYRSSAQHRLQVWRSARRAWLAAGLTQAEAARVMGMTAPRVSNALKPNDDRVLNFEEASRLAVAVELADGPFGLLPPPQSVSTATIRGDVDA